MRQFLVWIDSTGIRTDLTPSMINWKKAADGVDGAAPSISKLSVGTGIYYFDYTVTEDTYWEADSGDTNMVGTNRYKVGIVTPNDNKLTVLTTPTDAKTLTVTVTDGSDPLQGVEVYAFNLVGAIVNKALTGSNGECSLLIDSGSYTLLGKKDGYEFTATAISISSSTSTSLVGTPIEIDTVEGTQLLFAKLMTASLIADPDIKMTASPVPSGSVDSDGNIFVTNETLASFVSARQRYELPIAKGQRFLIKISSRAGTPLFSKEITTTEDDSKDFSDYIMGV